MLKNLLLKYILLINLVWLFGTIQAQFNFKYTAGLEEVTQAGFYQIDLTPPVIAKLQSACQDLRIVDAKGAQIPYLLRSDIAGDVNYYALKHLPILSNKTEADKQTHVVVENNLKSSINNMVLLIKNTDATRAITISGSDNLHDWYIIKENVTLNNLSADTADTFAQELFFPNSNYRYFKIIILGKETLPLNITRVSVPAHNFVGKSNYISLPGPVILQKDSSDGYSYITLRFNDSYLINRLSLKIEGAKFFKRSLYIYGDTLLRETQNLYSLSSNEKTVYSISSKSNLLILKIQNNDNPPLRVTAASGYQLHRWLITWLEKGNGYQLVFGDSSATAPRYDITFFKDSIRTVPILLSYAKPVLSKVSIPEKKENENKIWMWVIIISVLAVLIFFTLRMTREINKNN
ncbi:MAG: hypothetical protein H7122_00165 [Chitinophagaceae bacterium]|nr:hypothetical protein [Chitinophagaceae bacterium]